MKELICIVCPNGCRLRVDPDADFAVSGAKCSRGIEYGKTELCNPTRVVTSTVCIEGGAYPRLPVKTDHPIAKSKVFDVMRLLDGVTVKSPVRTGDVILRNILGTDVSIVACKDM